MPVSVSTGIVFVLVCVCLLHEGQSRLNNVCRTLKDYSTIVDNPNCWYNPDVGAPPAQLVKNHGFPFESYEVISPDGYILGVFRIPHNGTDIKKKRTPVLLHHGIMFDSMTFLVNGKISPAFILSNNGYDVWLINVRGCLYSSRHIKYTNHDRRYWDFSFHEMGYYDIPAVIDFIAMKTGQKGNIVLMGYSMGTTTSFIYASQRPKHAQSHLKAIVSLAPIVFLKNVKSPLKVLSSYMDVLLPLLRPIVELGATSFRQFMTGLPRQVCSTYPFMVFCEIIFEMLSGSNIGEVKPEDMPVAFSQSFSGFSLKTILHYGQMLLPNSTFQEFDYGPEGNLGIYNSPRPPKYDLTRVNVPVHLFYGKNDLLSVEEDVKALHETLKTPKSITSVFEEDKNYYSHMDFGAGRNSVKLFNIISNHIGT